MNIKTGNVKYKVYHSAEAPGLPPDAWNSIGTLEGTNFTTAPLGPALRHYFKVQAWNGIYESGPSNVVFVEIPI